MVSAARRMARAAGNPIEHGAEVGRQIAIQEAIPPVIG